MLCIKVASIYCDLICADESVVTIWFKVNYTKIGLVQKWLPCLA